MFRGADAARLGHPCSMFNLEPVKEFLDELRETRGDGFARPKLKPEALPAMPPHGQATVFMELREEVTRRFEE